MARKETTATTVKTVTVLAAVFLAAAMLSTFATGDTGDTNDNATVNVTVATKTMVDITPNEYVWDSVDPGAQGGHDSSKHRAQIENIGSTNISKVWFNATAPSSNPFATGNANNYDAGNFIALDQEGQNNYQFVDRVEFNETRELVYLTDTDGNSPPGTNHVYGRFRNTSFEYFWMIDMTGGTDCGSLVFRDGNTAHTQTQTGTVDFSDGASDYEEPTLNKGTTTTCLADVDLGSSGDSYVAVIENNTLTSTDPKVHLTKWNADYTGITSQSNFDYFWDNTQSGYLLPGNSTVAELNTYVPHGVADGEVSTGTLRAIVKGA